MLHLNYCNDCFEHSLYLSFLCTYSLTTSFCCERFIIAAIIYPHTVHVLLGEELHKPSVRSDHSVSVYDVSFNIAIISDNNETMFKASIAIISDNNETMFKASLLCY